MKWLKRRRAHHHYIARVLGTKIALDIGGQALIGPMSLENLALCIRYSGCSAGDDILEGSLAPGMAPRVGLRVWPG